LDLVGNLFTNADTGANSGQYAVNLDTASGATVGKVHFSDNYVNIDQFGTGVLNITSLVTEVDGNGNFGYLLPGEIRGYSVPLNAALGTELVNAAGATTDFASALTGWSQTGSNWEWSAANGGQALHSITSAKPLYVTTGFTGVAGKTIVVTYVVSGYSAGTVTPKYGNVSGTSRSADGTYTETITATSTNAFQFVPSADFAGAISNVIAYFSPVTYWQNPNYDDVLVKNAKIMVTTAGTAGLVAEAGVVANAMLTCTTAAQRFFTAADISPASVPVVLDSMTVGDGGVQPSAFIEIDGHEAGNDYFTVVPTGETVGPLAGRLYLEVVGK
jgi:hypothetical protein